MLNSAFRTATLYLWVLLGKPLNRILLCENGVGGLRQVGGHFLQSERELAWSRGPLLVNSPEHNHNSAAFCSLIQDLTRGSAVKRLHGENCAESFGIWEAESFRTVTARGRQNARSPSDTAFDQLRGASSSGCRPAV